MSYLPYVDGLRAIAIAAVVAFHAFPMWLSGGFVGVDVFFVISGFLITRFIAAEISSGSFSLSQFFVRRARRLLPAAVMCFALVTILAGFVLLPDAYLYHGRSLLGALLMYANIFFYRTGGYFSAPSLEKPLLHTWSLAVEDQFYLTWPLILMVLLPRVSRRVLIASVAVLIAASLAYAHIKVVRDSDFAFYMLPTRCWELLLGAAVALMAGSITRMSRMSAEALTGAGLIAIAASCFALSPASTFPGLSAVPACLGTAAVIGGGLAGQTTISRVLSLRPFVFVGLLSYSLYLWHWPLIALASYWAERPLAALEAAGIVALSFAIAFLSWRYVEQPFRARHQTRQDHDTAKFDRRFIAGALVGIASVAASAAAIKITRGLPQRYTSGVRHVLDQMVATNPWRARCDNYDMIFKNDAFCNFGRKKSDGESYEVAMFGDSMGDHWVPMVADYASKENLAGRQTTNGGCAFLVGVDIPAVPAAKARECASYQREAMRFVDANPKLKVVVVSALWDKWINALDRDMAPNAPVRPSLKTFADTLDYFTKRGIRVLLIGQVPGYDQLPVRCITEKVNHSEDPGVCGRPSGAPGSKSDRSNADLQNLANANPLVTLFLPSDVICDDMRCRPVVEGTMLYKDAGHLNRFGAQYLGRFITFPRLD